MASEVWKSVVGFEGEYEVSDLGRVKSLRRTIDRKCKGTRVCPERVMRPQTRSGGYLGVELYRDGKPKLVLVHRLVCEAFHGSPPEGHEVAHTDGTRTNNTASNLRWATRVENAADKTAHGRMVTWERHPSRKLLPEQALEIRARARAGEPCAQIARDYPCSAVTVKSIADGKTWKTI
jgi:hypothetical protein